jgi:arsenate reductase (thioredoxin)
VAHGRLTETKRLREVADDVVVMIARDAVSTLIDIEEAKTMPQALDPVTQHHIEQAADRLAEEFAGVFSRQTIARYMAESQDLLGEARINVFVPVLAHRFARARLKALAQAEGRVVKEQPEVLFVCVHNAGRSQMAAGLVMLRSHGRVHVRSAGSVPADEVNPAVVQAMDEIGVDMSEEFPKPLTDEVVRAADVVITMGCGDACPIYPGKRYEDWELEDPDGKDLGTVRKIRDEIDQRVQNLIGELVPDSAASTS